ncbi:MAG: 30S ribosomal protein S17 [Thermoplasmatales archaeon]|nr:MAG: 30S ribosomal protein S17 [Thermoplasmatales archaeon]
MAEKKEARNIGVQVKPPAESCEDKNCPFHGSLPIRGQIITGKVVSSKMQGSISVTKEFMHYVKKYERYEKRTSTYPAHCPPCINLKEGDKVRIAECRPLNKTVSFVAIEKL